MVDFITRNRNKKHTMFLIEEKDISSELKNDIQRNPLVLHYSDVMNSMCYVLFYSNVSIEFMKLIDVFIIDETLNIVLSNFSQPVSILELFVKRLISSVTFCLNQNWKLLTLSRSTILNKQIKSPLLDNN
ncbi:hypothetical protein CDIK_2030 [Cucumispora dikerogammari]|nr:hypothetical protein CDIK_2030 [Cucumispora dikerogammari]